MSKTKSSTERAPRRKRRPRRGQLYRTEFHHPKTLRDHGVRPDDHLLVTYADEGGWPRDGEICFMHFRRDNPDACDCVDAGVFRRESGGRFSVARDSDAEDDTDPEVYLPGSEKYLMRIVAIEHAGGETVWLAGEWEGMQPLPLPDPEPGRGEAEESEGRSEQIERLRDRIARLDEVDHDAITNSTRRFQLERELYDLERRAGADEWPEVIGGD